MRGIVIAEVFLCEELPHELVKLILLYDGEVVESQGRDWCTQIYVSAWQRAFGRTFKLDNSLFEKNISFYVSCASVMRESQLNVKLSRSVKHRDGLFGLIEKYDMEKEFTKYARFQGKYFDRRVNLSSYLGNHLNHLRHPRI